MLYGPTPVADFRQVVAVFRHVEAMALYGFGVPLARLLYLWCEPLYPRDCIESQLVAVDVVEHAHVERRGCRAFLFVAAHVNVVVIVPAIGEPVDAPGIAVKSKDNRNVRRENAIEVFVGKPVRMLGG